MVGQHRLALRRRDHHPRHRTRHVPFLERKHGPHHEPDAIGKFQRRAADDGRKFQPFARMHDVSPCSCRTQPVRRLLGSQLTQGGMRPAKYFKICRSLSRLKIFGGTRCVSQRRRNKSIWPPNTRDDPRRKFVHARRAIIVRRKSGDGGCSSSGRTATRRAS